MLGKKSEEFTIWTTAFRHRLKKNGGQPFLLKMVNKMATIKSYRPTDLELRIKYNIIFKKKIQK